MVKFVDRVKMNLTTTGTGTVTFGSVVSGFQSLSDASVVDADVVRYTIESGTNYESGTGTIGLTGSTYTMARSPSSSSESDNSAINLGAGAVCFLTMLAEDVVQNLADLDNVSSTSPAGGQNLSWDASASSWVPASPSGGITSVGNYAGLPASPNETDLAWVQDQKALYVYDGTEWDRVSTGSQTTPRYTTIPPSTLSLDTSGTDSTITAVAVDDAGFPITYDWDGFSGSTLYNSSSLPPQVTSVSESNGVFSLAASTSSSHAGSFTFRTKASDGVLTTTASTDVTLTFGLADCYGFSISQDTGFMIVWYQILDDSGVNMFDDATFVNDCTLSATQYGHNIIDKNTTLTEEASKAPGYFVAQQNALFGTSPADTTAVAGAVAAHGSSIAVTIKWTTPRTIGAIMLSGLHPDGSDYWQTGDVKAFIGGSDASDLTTAYALTASTQTGFTSGYSKYVDFTA